MIKTYTPLLLLTSLILLTACDQNEQKTSAAYPEDTKIVTIIKENKKDAFLVTEANARYSLSDDDDRIVVLKQGLEVDVTGVTSDKKYYEIKNKSIKEKLYVPSESIGLIGKGR